MKKTQILLVEDHTIVREGFRKMLELESDFEVVGEAQDGRKALEVAKLLRPDIILMDIAMPELNGLESTRQLIKTLPMVKVLFLSAHNDDAYVTSAIQSGAVGFVLKQDSSHEVCCAIRKVMKGETYFSHSITRRLNRLDPKSRGRLPKSLKSASKLTSREMEVLQLIAEGRANKQIASDLGISIKTVEKHREHLMEKLDIHDTAGITRYAISAGIIESSVQVTIL